MFDALQLPPVPTSTTCDQLLDTISQQLKSNGAIKPVIENLSTSPFETQLASVDNLHALRKLLKNWIELSSPISATSWIAVPLTKFIDDISRFFSQQLIPLYQQTIRRPEIANPETTLVDWSRMQNYTASKNGINFSGWCESQSKPKTIANLTDYFQALGITHEPFLHLALNYPHQGGFDGTLTSAIKSLAFFANVAAQDTVEDRHMYFQQFTKVDGIPTLIFYHELSLYPVLLARAQNATDGKLLPSPYRVTLILTFEITYDGISRQYNFNQISYEAEMTPLVIPIQYPTQEVAFIKKNMDIILRILIDQAPIFDAYLANDLTDTFPETVPKAVALLPRRRRWQSRFKATAMPAISALFSRYSLLNSRPSFTTWNFIFSSITLDHEVLQHILTTTGIKGYLQSLSIKPLKLEAELKAVLVEIRLDLSACTRYYFEHLEVIKALDAVGQVKTFYELGALPTVLIYPLLKYGEQANTALFTEFTFPQTRRHSQPIKLTSIATVRIVEPPLADEFEIVQISMATRIPRLLSLDENHLFRELFTKLKFTSVDIKLLAENFGLAPSVVQAAGPQLSFAPPPEPLPPPKAKPFTFGKLLEIKNRILRDSDLCQFVNQHYPEIPNYLSAMLDRVRHLDELARLLSMIYSFIAIASEELDIRRVKDKTKTRILTLLKELEHDCIEESDV